MTDGTVETEIKLRIPNADHGKQLLESRGFHVLKERVFEANNVYDTASGDIRGGGCLLRLRLAGEKATLTYKGVATPGIHKSRPETEVQVSSFDNCDSILRQLGYRLVFGYQKYRTEYQRSDEHGTATLDETPIGCFMELEGPAEWIDSTAQELGFDRSAYVLASYGSLYLEHCHTTGCIPGNMSFSEG